MSNHVIAIDAMGGDNAPNAVIKGLNHFCSKNKENDFSFIVYGDEKRLNPIIKKYKKILKKSTIVHCDDCVGAHDKPSKVIKKSRNTSMWQAIKAVKDKKADTIVSAGNTGCLMAFSKLQLRTIEGIKRPAITGIIPTKKNVPVVMLDLGANTECDVDNLIEFAYMGSVYSKIMTGTKKPTVGLLNIGEEDTKGNDILRKTNEKLKSKKQNVFKYYGFIEGHDITDGTTDVVVTDGFTGNIALKTIEGTAKFMSSLLKDMFKKSINSRIAYLMLSNGLRKFKKNVDSRTYNGGLFAGLNGIVVKSHGNSDHIAFSNAIKYALNFSRNNFTSKIKKNLNKK